MLATLLLQYTVLDVFNTWKQVVVLQQAAVEQRKQREKKRGWEREKRWPSGERQNLTAWFCASAPLRTHILAMTYTEHTKISVYSHRGTSVGVGVGVGG